MPRQRATTSENATSAASLRRTNHSHAAARIVSSVTRGLLTTVARAAARLSALHSKARVIASRNDKSMASSSDLLQPPHSSSSSRESRSSIFRAPVRFVAVMIHFEHATTEAIVGFVLDLSKSMRENTELLEDLCRFSEQLLSEGYVRKKYRDLLDTDDWIHLASDDSLIELIETRKLQRVRDGSYKRERSQQLVATKAIDALDKIVSDEKVSPPVQN
jgi:hypothetical protein